MRGKGEDDASHVAAAAEARAAGGGAGGGGGVATATGRDQRADAGAGGGRVAAATRHVTIRVPSLRVLGVRAPRLAAAIAQVTGKAVVTVADAPPPGEGPDHRMTIAEPGGLAMHYDAAGGRKEGRLVQETAVEGETR